MFSKQIAALQNSIAAVMASGDAPLVNVLENQLRRYKFAVNNTLHADRADADRVMLSADLHVTKYAGGFAQAAMDTIGLEIRTGRILDPKRVY